MVSIAFEKLTLPNGLDVILHQDHTLPLVAVNIWYHVGSKDEEVGRTGFAHLFEHLMFEGSKHHNRSHFEPLQRVGAMLNGSTTTDRTNYWETLPSNYLELALWLEADRMGFLLEAMDQERFNVQREVVKNERRQNYENRPYGMASALVQEALYPLPHPYHWLTIGSPEDLDRATLEDAKAFFRRFYSPSNSSLVVAGDFESDEAKRLVQRYFADLSPGPSLTRHGRWDSALQGQVELTMQDKVHLARLYQAWPTPPRFDSDGPPLAVLAAVLGEGKSSRLHRSLVYEKQIAQAISVFHFASELAGQFLVEVTAAPGHTLDEMREAAETELERLRQQPPTEEEMARAKNHIQASRVRQLERLGGFGGRADQLNYFNLFAGDPDRLNSDLERFLAVEPADVQRVAKTTLGNRRVQLRVLPERPLVPSASTVDRTAEPSPRLSPPFTPLTPQRHRLSNGIGVLVAERRGLPLVALGLLLQAGAVTDPQHQPGLAYLTAHLLSEGTTTRSSQQIAAEFEFIDAQLIAHTDREYLLLETETLTTHWPKALELLADLARHPTFPEDELARIRKRHLAELARTRDDVNMIAWRVAPTLFYGAKSAFGHPVSGTEEAIAAITRDDIARHYQLHYRPEDATLIVAGDVSLDEVMARVEAMLADWSAKAAGDRPSIVFPTHNSPPPTNLVLVDKPGAAQSVIRAGHLTIPRDHPDYHALNLLNFAFGGQFSARLNMNLRQAKGYSYGYRSWIDWQRGPSLLLAGGSVHTAVTKEAVAETLKEFSELCGSRPLAAQEFEDAKAGFLRGLPTSFETLGQMMGHLVELVLFDLPDTYYATLGSKLEAISLADLHRVAKERIHPDRFTVLVVGDRPSVEPGLRELGLPIVLTDPEGKGLAGSPGQGMK